jgi:hypothetical protein
MNSIKLFFTISICLSALVIKAQLVNPNEIRVKIYDTIYKDIQKQSSPSIQKEIVIDPNINKFSDYKMDEFGLKLDSVRYDPNINFCTKTSPYKCVAKFDIDRYTVVNVYKDKKESVSTDFYGIYAPLDHWYNLIYYAAVKHFEKDRKFNFTTILPVRNVRMKEGEIIERYYFYKFNFDESFRILKFEKIN